jgi:hypothetical protein
MISAFEAAAPSVGIFWLIETTAGTTQWLSAGCSLEAAEPYGDFLSFPGGHYEVWERWRQRMDLDAALRALVRSFEYEDWPRGRIVYDRSKKRFTLCADAKLMKPKITARIRARFALPVELTSVERDFHYQSSETPSRPD